MTSDDGMVNVLFETGKQIKLDETGQVHSISNFKEINNVFIDRYKI